MGLFGRLYAGADLGLVFGTQAIGGGAEDDLDLEAIFGKRPWEKPEEKMKVVDVVETEVEDEVEVENKDEETETSEESTTSPDEKSTTEE